MHGTYLFAQGEDGLYIIDQHAAQERCKYEFYRKEIGKVGSEQQNLLVPLVLDYSTSDILMINQNLDKLEDVGIHLEEFGRNSYIVHHHPTWFKAGQEESILREMIDYILKDGAINIASYREKTAIMMSCKRSIKANHHLDDLQAKTLLNDLKNVKIRLIVHMGVLFLSILAIQIWKKCSNGFKIHIKASVQWTKEGIARCTNTLVE